MFYIDEKDKGICEVLMKTEGDLSKIGNFTWSPFFSQDTVSNRKTMKNTSFIFFIQLHSGIVEKWIWTDRRMDGQKDEQTKLRLYAHHSWSIKT